MLTGRATHLVARNLVPLVLFPPVDDLCSKTLGLLVASGGLEMFPWAGFLHVG